MSLNAAWEALLKHHASFKKTSLNTLFQKDSGRFGRYCIQLEGLFADLSKHHIVDDTLHLLVKLAEAASLPAAIEALFTGQRVNVTENLPALHTALRDSTANPIEINGKDIKIAIQTMRQQIAEFVTAVYDGVWRGYSDQAITDVVNLGIGGSDLGPKLAITALKQFSTGEVDCHFVSNVDGTAILETLKTLNPETTLFIVASKSFTTEETLLNAKTAREWLLQATDEASIKHHFVAVTARMDRAKDFGIDFGFPMWDFVGGRYSLWSAIGLPVALSIGVKRFNELLSGAYAMDQHFRQTALAKNLPVLMGLLGVWYDNFWQAESHAILPYDERLKHLPDYLQQLDMESNGKSVTQAGKAVTTTTGPIVWGGVGTNGQHAFHQLLHQGTHFVPVDFIIAKHQAHPLVEHHQALVANCLAQAQALMQGKTLEKVKQELLAAGMDEKSATALAPHKVISGNKPSTMLILDELTPRTLGMLIALYEHKVYVQSVIWQINAFDQWGVELGKQLGQPLVDALQNDAQVNADSSTLGLLAYLKA